MATLNFRGYSVEVETHNNQEFTAPVIKVTNSNSYWADGTNRNTKEIYSKLNLEENEFNEEVLSILCDLSED